MKRCTKCGELKPLTEFNKNKFRKDGLALWCRQCRGEYRESNREKLREKDREWSKTHREKRRVHWKQHYQKNREKRLETNQDWKLKNPEKMVAGNKLNQAISDGEIKRPDKCQHCKKKPDRPLQGHHEDYSKLLEVIWLCRSCHMSLHAERRR